MSRIHNLVTVLTEVIRTYYKISSQNKTLDATTGELSALIAQSKEKRQSLLNYLDYYRQTLDEFTQNPTPALTQLTPLAPELQSRLKQFFLELQTLLHTSQNNVVSVHYNEQAISIYGLKTGFLQFYKRSTLGNLLYDQLFTPFGLTTTTTENELDKLVSSWFKDYHCELFERENQRLQNEIQRLNAEYNALFQTLITSEYGLNNPENSKAVLSPSPLKSSSKLFDDENECIMLDSLDTKLQNLLDIYNRLCSGIVTKKSMIDRTQTRLLALGTQPQNETEQQKQLRTTNTTTQQMGQVIVEPPLANDDLSEQSDDEAFLKNIFSMNEMIESFGFSFRQGYSGLGLFNFSTQQPYTVLQQTDDAEDERAPLITNLADDSQSADRLRYNGKG
jgi:hypothetical protein